PITRPSDEAHIALLTGFQYLVSISEVDDDNIFKICLDYWHLLTRDLYSIDQTQAQSHGMNVLALTRRGAEPDPLTRKSLLKVILSRLRVVMISKMVKPSEVLIVEDENGEIVRETTKDTEALSQYKTMHEGLVYLTHLDYDDTENIMLEKLTDQVEGNGWSWNNLNTLCWAIGSISGAMSEENEKRFLVTVIKDLLGLCEMKRGKDNKAVVASNIMYVVGQYPRFLRAHWKFLKTVVNKLFEFMHELHPGVQDMACDTFLKIAQKCRRKFVVLQPGEPYPFVEELMMELPKTVSDLEPHQLHTFYEAVASMLAAETIPARKDTLVAELMKLPNAAWQNLMQQAAHNVDVLFDAQAVKEIVKIIRTNGNVCKAIGPNGFNAQMGTLFQDLLNVYRTYTQRIAQRVAQGGDIATKSAEVRSLRSAKKESLRLFEAFVEHSSADDNGRQTIARHFLPLLLEVVLTDYKTTVASAKEAEVLTLLATCISKLKAAVAPAAPGMLEAVFECTLQMITRNFEDFPEHRVNFFKLLKAVNEFCGLETLFALLLNVRENETLAASFYRSFYLSLLQDILVVLTDRLHKFGFKMHAALLKHMFSLVEMNQVNVPLWESLPGMPPVMPVGQTNSQFLKEYVANMISTSFPNMSPAQVRAFVVGCFDMTKDLAAFKKHLRDFLVNVKEFAGEDNADLFLEESLAMTQERLARETNARLAVPGLVNPHERPDANADDMADL
ncbi:hypothetical protein DYB30_009860, partial [Aphanomyces astaci]